MQGCPERVSRSLPAIATLKRNVSQMHGILGLLAGALEKSIAEGKAGREEVDTQEQVLENVAGLLLHHRSAFWKARDTNHGCSLQLKLLYVAFDRAFACHKESAARAAALSVIVLASMEAPKWVRNTIMANETNLVVRRGGSTG